jgi:hypothetical protein
MLNLEDSYRRSFMDIEGTWKVRYAAKQQPPFITEEGDEEETATIVLEDGKVTGKDPFGFEYSGEYSLNGDAFEAMIHSKPYEPNAVSIFPGLTGASTLNVKGHYRSPDHFSAEGFIVEHPSYQFVLICNRAK